MRNVSFIRLLIHRQPYFKQRQLHRTNLDGLIPYSPQQRGDSRITNESKCPSSAKWSGETHFWARAVPMEILM